MTLLTLGLSYLIGCAPTAPYLIHLNLTGTAKVESSAVSGTLDLCAVTVWTVRDANGVPSTIEEPICQDVVLEKEFDGYEYVPVEFVTEFDSTINLPANYDAQLPVLSKVYFEARLSNYGVDNYQQAISTEGSFVQLNEAAEGDTATTSDGGVPSYEGSYTMDFNFSR